MFRDMELDAMLHIKTTNAMWYWHNYGITKDKFIKNKNLNKNFHVTAESTTHNGTTFVASFEHEHMEDLIYIILKYLHIFLLIV